MVNLNKEEYLSKLSDSIYNIPYLEKTKIIEYYREIIEDKIESGQNEEDVLNELGNVDLLAKKIMSENPSFTNIKTTPNTNKYNGSSRDDTKSPTSTTKIVLIILAIFLCPIIIPLVLGILAVLFSLIVTGIAIVFSFGAIAVVLAITAIILFASAFTFIAVNLSGMFYMIGVSMLFAGVSIFFILGSISLFKVTIKFVSFISKYISNTISKKVGSRL